MLTLLILFISVFLSSANLFFEVAGALALDGRAVGAQDVHRQDLEAVREDQPRPGPWRQR